MNNRTKSARQYLTDIPDKKTYLELMDKAKLTPTERTVCDMKYLQGQNFCFIGDSLGFSEDWIKRIHRAALIKLSKIVEN